MIDPLLSLSFNLHAQHGTYALLLGSGISRSASIPTGWEVTQDLLAKLAHMAGDDCGGDEAAWYAKKYGAEPNYSEVLKAIAPTSAAQQQLLKAYFEPTEKDREEGKKLPTAAHKAIAKLVASGHIRVIVTTNFDRLLEIALEAEGVQPVVIASPDAARGAPPLAHTKCTVIKVHGDYLDHRIKNSVEALSKYDKTTNRLLDQVFDEYGLITCGWSADYDIALRQALERVKSRRYPLYWTGMSDPDGAVKGLIALHSAQFLKIDGADIFFVSLLEKVGALEEFNRPHPVSTNAAVVALKRYLSEDKFRIQLRDFLVIEAQEVQSVMEAVSSEFDSISPEQATTSQFMRRLESGVETLAHLFATGALHATGEQSGAFFDAFHLVIAKAGSRGGYVAWTNLRRYPALTLIYAVGVVSVASGNYSVLAELASRPSFIKHDDDKEVTAPVRVSAEGVMEHRLGQSLLANQARAYTPFSNYMIGQLRPFLASAVPEQNLYERAFTNFEYLWSLLHIDAKNQLESRFSYRLDGVYTWRWRDYESGGRMSDQVLAVIESDEEDWPPLVAGLFGGKLSRLKSAFEVQNQR